MNERSTNWVFRGIGRGVWRLLTLLIFLTASVEAVGVRVVSYNVGARFEDGGFRHGIGEPGTADHDRVVEVLSRIDADVVALQEIHFEDLLGTPDDLEALADSLGLPYVHVASASGATDFQLRVVILSRYPFLDTELIRSPTDAKEIARQMPAVKVDVPDTDFDPWVVSVHLKAGSSSADRFRKSIELQRLAGFLSEEGITAEDPVVILGDFNLVGSDRSFTEQEFEDLTLPASYSLGDDIAFPVSYDNELAPYFPSIDPVILDPLQIDGNDATFESGSVLDLIAVSPGLAARPVRAEVYNSELDVSNATGLPKAGTPLEEDASSEASDHFPVFADIELSDPDPYFLTEAGSTLLEDFEGFDGLFNPAPWSSNGVHWIGEDDGSSRSIGGRSFGNGLERAPGFVLGTEEQVLEAEFVNQSPGVITTLDLSYVAEQWRSSFEGSRDRIEVDLVQGDLVTRLDPLDFDARRDLAGGAVPGGASYDRSLRLSGLSISQDDSFKLRFRFVPGAEIAPPSVDVFVNEFHYDNLSADQGEFFEIVVASGYMGALSDVSLVFYNGNDGGQGSSHDLTTFDPGTITDSGHRVFSKAISGIQNGAPDGFALIVDGMVRSFLSYEGSFMAVDGPAAGLTSTDIGVAQASTEPAGEAALGLIGTGGGSVDFAWTRFLGIGHSPGLPNDGQTFVTSGLPPQGLAIDDLMVSIVSDRDGDGLPDDEDPDDDNDGQSDDEELAFGTDPLDADSKFTIRLGSDGDNRDLSFPGADGVAYTVEWSDGLGEWKILTTRIGSGSFISVLLPTEQPKAFFRVRVSE